MSIWDLLPDELCGIIFDHVGDKYQEIVNFRRVSQRFKDIIDKRNTSRVEKRKRMDFVEDEGTSQDLWQRCRDTFAARKRQRLATDVPPHQLVLPYFSVALQMDLLQTLVLTPEFKGDFSLDWLSIHCTQVTSFDLPHHVVDKDEMVRFLQRRGATLKSLKMPG